MKNEYIINACSGLAVHVKKGGMVTVIDTEGKQVVDFFAVNARNTNEFLSTGVTIDCNESLKLKAGDMIYSNLYSPLLRVIEDDVEEHDLLHPCCSTQMYDFFYGNGEGHRNCLDNINSSLAGFDIPKANLIHPVNLFMHTVIHPDGTVSVEEPCSNPGDKIVFMAEVDLVICAAACSVKESKCNGGSCTPVKIIVEE